MQCGRRFSFSCFARSDSFSTVPRASGLIFIFSTPGLMFGRTEGVGSCFHVLRARTRFRWVPKASGPVFIFARSDSFSAVPSASGPVFMFCAPGLVFGGTEGVGFRFHVLRAWTSFRRCQVRRVLFSRFSRPHSFLAVPSASDSVFIFCTSGLIFDGTEGTGSRFHV
jgi:hypothetical protein